jgi:L-amino acid N-acyltransferase YncA
MMQIRHYHPGDEHAQAEIFNAAAGSLPKFKPATAEEIARRYRTTDADPKTKFYAVENGQIIGYAVYSANGRISFPWHRSGAEHSREPLLTAVLAALTQRGVHEAWAAYRADWRPVQAFLLEYGFRQTHEMINFVAELAGLSHEAPPPGTRIAPVDAAELVRAWELGETIFAGEDHGRLTKFFLDNPYFDPTALFALKHENDTLGIGLAIVNPQYADPTKLDAAMPCFRLGAMGTETERHKRVNGMFSCVFDVETTGEALLAEAIRRFEAASLTHAAAQCRSDQPALRQFYESRFQRQGSFPILARELQIAN